MYGKVDLERFVLVAGVGVDDQLPLLAFEGVVDQDLALASLLVRRIEHLSDYISSFLRQVDSLLAVEAASFLHFGEVEL